MHSGFTQERDKFIFEGMLGAVFRLVFNITYHRLAVRCADAEGSVALLPGEVDFMFADPAGGVCFEKLRRLRESDCSGQGD